MTPQPIPLQLYEIELQQRRLERESEDQQLQHLKAKLEAMIREQMRHQSILPK